MPEPLAARGLAKYWCMMPPRLAQRLRSLQVKPRRVRPYAFAHSSKDCLMVVLMLFGAIAFIANLRLVVKVWQVNAFFGIVTFFFFPVSIFFLFKHWGDPDHDIKLVFVITLVASILTGYQFDTLKAQAREYSNAQEPQSR